jgi:hypothetical protein
MREKLLNLPRLSATWLETQFRHNRHLGSLTWISSRPGVQGGSIAGSRRHPTSQLYVQINHKAYPVSLLIWVMHRRTWPSHFPMYADGDILNCRYNNLYLPVGATQSDPEPIDKSMQHRCAVAAARKLHPDFATRAAPMILTSADGVLYTHPGSDTPAIRFDPAKIILPST